MKKEIEDASSFWLSPAAIQRLVALYLSGKCGEERDFLLGGKALKTLRLSQEGRAVLLGDFQKLPRHNTPDHRGWENWLKGGDPHLSITFDADCARQHPEAAFIMPLHPLVKQAGPVAGDWAPGLNCAEDKEPRGPSGPVRICRVSVAVPGNPGRSGAQADSLVSGRDAALGKRA